MHIPDNYLSPATCAVLGGIMIPIWKRAANRIKLEISKKKMPMLGICAAFSFLIMMFNLPLPGGTTGHAVGATLIAILLGPYSAIITVTIALAIQALFFGDGGILAFGANSFNMAFIMPIVGYYIYRLIKGKSESEKVDYLAAFLGSYGGIVVAAFFAALELGTQPILFKDAGGVPLYCPYPLSISIPAMLIPHMLIVGVVEGIFTAGVYSYVKKMSPGTLYEGAAVKTKKLYELIIVLIILCPIGLMAGGTAWGEWGSNEIKSMLGFVPKSMVRGFNFGSPMSKYGINGLSSISGYIASAIIGTIILILIFRLFYLKMKKETK